MTRVSELTIAECRLLNAEDDQLLLDDFNCAVTQQDQIRQAFGDEFLNDKVMSGLLQRLARVREKLVKTHYSIGFIGATQNGKSTACNYVLDATHPDDQVGREGLGENTTSTVSRLRRGPRSLQLVYMTRAQVDQKLTYLREACGFDPELTDEQIQRQISGRLRELEQGLSTRTRSDRMILPRDLELLEDLLRIQRSHQSLIETAPTPRKSEFGERNIYLNYGPRAHAANGLLREAIIGYESPHLPHELEMFDLPGPGAKSSIDEWTTRQFLGQMDGVMLFINAAKVEEEPTEILVSRLREVFRERTPRRAWLVFTRWDGPTRAALDGDGERSIFTVIHDFLRTKKFEPHQIRFVCGPWYLLQKSSVVDHFASRLGTPGNPLPCMLTDYPVFESAFQQLFIQGGIPALRELILQTLPKDVRADLREECAGEVKMICESLIHRYKNEERRRNASTQDRALASANCRRGAEILMEVDRSREPFEQAAVDLRQELEAVFREHCPSPEILDHRRLVAASFPRHVEMLEERLLVSVETDLVPRLYDYWQPKFDGLAKIPVLANVDGAGAVWRDFGIQDSRNGGWRGPQFPTFFDIRLFNRLGPESEADLQRGQAYWEMIGEKISLVAQQTVHALRVRLSERALAIQVDLEQLVNSSKFSLPRPLLPMDTD